MMQVHHSLGHAPVPRIDSRGLLSLPPSQPMHSQQISIFRLDHVFFRVVSAQCAQIHKVLSVRDGADDGAFPRARLLTLSRGERVEEGRGTIVAEVDDRLRCAMIRSASWLRCFWIGSGSRNARVMIRMMPSANRNRNEPISARYSRLDVCELASFMTEGKRTSITSQ